MTYDGNDSRIKINYHAFNIRKKNALIILYYRKQRVSICCLRHSRYILTKTMDSVSIS